MSGTRLLCPLFKRVLAIPSTSHQPAIVLKALSTSCRLRVEKFRTVKEYEDGDMLVVEGVQEEMPGSSGHEHPTNACPICSRNLEVKYTDVLILEQFVSNKGQILPRKVTGLCVKQHNWLEISIEMAQKAGLLPPPHLGDHLQPPETLQIPKGSFHIFYNKNNKRKNYKVGKIQ